MAKLTLTIRQVVLVMIKIKTSHHRPNQSYSVRFLHLIVLIIIRRTGGSRSTFTILFCMYFPQHCPHAKLPIRGKVLTELVGLQNNTTTMLNDPKKTARISSMPLEMASLIAHRKQQNFKSKQTPYQLVSQVSIYQVYRLTRHRTPFHMLRICSRIICLEESTIIAQPATEINKLSKRYLKEPLENQF